jgi:hypothetical protein
MQEQAVVITNTLFFWPWPPINSLDGLLEHFLNIPPKLSIQNFRPAYESTNFILWKKSPGRIKWGNAGYGGANKWLPLELYWVLKTWPTALPMGEIIYYSSPRKQCPLGNQTATLSLCTLPNLLHRYTCH